MKPFEVYALRYATFPERTRGENFCFAGTNDDEPMPLDYFFWCIRGEDSLFILDTGAAEQTAVRRGRTFLHEPQELLDGIDVAADTCSDVVLSHLHWDHAGGTAWFPAATFHVQQSELDFVTGSAMRHEVVAAPFEQADIDDVLSLGERLVRHSGTTTLAPGLESHLLGGHTGGLQALRVLTARGWMLLASDALHFHENRRTGNPFPIVADVVRMLDGHRTCERLADSEHLIIAGHDPSVRAWAPEVAPDVFQLAGGA